MFAAKFLTPAAAAAFPSSFLLRGYSYQILDKIHMKGMIFQGNHGVLPEERANGQTFVADATYSIDLRKAGKTDNLEDTVSYADVYNDIKSVIEGPPSNLLEKVASDACSRVLERHPKIQGVKIFVKKVCIPGVTDKVDTVGIEVVRYR